MAERKSFWSTMPGLVTGIAGIVTGLVALIPVVLTATGHKTANVSAPSQPPPISAPAGVSASASVSPTADSGTGSPGDTGGSSATGTSLADGATSQSPGGASASPSGTPSSGSGAGSGSGSASGGLTAAPASVDLGQATLGNATTVATIVISNPGGTPANLADVKITGPQMSEFAIASTTCGTSLGAQASCQVGVRFTASTLGAASAALEVDYSPPSSSAETVRLSAQGLLL